MAKRHPPTMADILAMERDRPRTPAARPVVPGQRNRDGVLATPDGERMEFVGHLEPGEAAAAAGQGALVVWGACGCGEADCGILEWIDGDSVRGAEPVLSGRGPGWFALWRSATHEVVFGHGEARWGAWPSH